MLEAAARLLQPAVAIDGNGNFVVGDNQGNGTLREGSNATIQALVKAFVAMVRGTAV